ncbi:MAG: hypothetical protein HYX46_01925 [Betaproteobacteria bacterium]|nr:hypothetical protein [Betaproteobacteria bacterium]
MSARFVAALLLALAAAAPDGHAQSSGPAASRIEAILDMVRPDSRLEMFYLSAPDCPYCTHWESHAKDELLAWTSGTSLSFVEIRGETLRLPITERHYPPEFRWVYEQIGPSRGVPRFLLAVDGRVLLSAYGTNRYREVFFPALKRVTARRAETRS